MVWRRIFPPEGGGAFRRFLRVRSDLFDRTYRSGDRPFKAPISLFDFENRDDAADAAAISTSGGFQRSGWRISDDEVIGGYSRGKMTLIRTPEEYRRHMGLAEAGRSEEMISMAGRDVGSSGDTNDDLTSEGGDPARPRPLNAEGDDGSHAFVPFVRWEGNLSTKIGRSPQSRNVARSGFAAIRSPEFLFSAPLKERYNALEIMCRSDGRNYTLNLKVSTYFPDDMYQGFINIPPTHPLGKEVCPHTGGKFNTLVVPFGDLILTAQGRMREVQRVLDGAIRIDHVGLTLMDGMDGPFQFDLGRVRAVNYFNGAILGEGGDEGEDDGDEGDETMEKDTEENKGSKPRRRGKIPTDWTRVV